MQCKEKKTNSKFCFNKLRKFQMFHVTDFWIFEIITNALFITECLDNFINSATKHNKGELKQNYTT